MPALVDLSTKPPFGRLRAIRRVGTRNGYALWYCECSCGNVVEVTSHSLQNGSTKSCGCLQIEKAVLMGKKNVKHGKSRTKEYRTWQAIINRCTNENLEIYKFYGAKGIRVCVKWMNSFEDFLTDVGECPPDKTSIDRFPDTSGDYEPGNVRWATPVEQSRNRKSNIILELEGERHCALEWAEITGIPKTTIYKRIQYGWDVKRILTTPIRNYPKRSL
jgi:hypothetical protein